MPKCVDCGTETPRDEMLGPRDELRCRACVNKRYPIEEPRSSVLARAFQYPPVTVVAMVIAILASLVYWSQHREYMIWMVGSPLAIWEGEVWRLVTTIFPHANPLHLVFNLFWLWRFGRAVESWMRPWFLAGFIVAVAAGSSAAQMMLGFTEAHRLMGGPVGVGLSGVGYGLFGLLYALRKDKDFAAAQIQPGVAQLFVGWFFLCLVMTYTNTLPVANTAHGVGGVLGWLFGQALLTRHRLAAVSGVVFLCVGLALATLYMPWVPSYCFARYRSALRRGDYPQAMNWLRRLVPNPEKYHPEWQESEDDR